MKKQPTFDRQTIEDHAFRSGKRLKKIVSDSFYNESSSMDSFTKRKRSGRIARKQISGKVSASAEDLLKDRPKPFWQIAPDGVTIERTYSPDDEPLLQKCD